VLHHDSASATNAQLDESSTSSTKYFTDLGRVLWCGVTVGLAPER
jgi:hypothetical protein